MNKDMVITVKRERRFCMINEPNIPYDGMIGFFHEWEQYSTSGFNHMYAIVELANEVWRFEVNCIKFIDVENDFLQKTEEALREREN